MVDFDVNENLNNITQEQRDNIKVAMFVKVPKIQQPTKS